MRTISQLKDSTIVPRFIYLLQLFFYLSVLETNL